jgi:hypothetical protein
MLIKLLKTLQKHLPSADRSYEQNATDAEIIARELKVHMSDVIDGLVLLDKLTTHALPFGNDEDLAEYVGNRVVKFKQAKTEEEREEAWKEVRDAMREFMHLVEGFYYSPLLKPNTQPWQKFKDAKPADGDHIWYCFTATGSNGVFRGEYNDHVLVSRHGFCDTQDAPYWMPYIKGARAPEAPAELKKRAEKDSTVGTDQGQTALRSDTPGNQEGAPRENPDLPATA